MSNTQSNDLLRELNAKLLAKIAELRKENAKIKTENTKLKQNKEDIEDVLQIKQASVTSQLLILLSIKNHSGKDDSTNFVNLEQTQSAISPKVNSNNISEQTDDMSKNTSNSDVCQSIYTKPNLSEDKEKNDFLNRIEKERVSNMIRERNQKKLQKKHSLELKTHQNPNLSLDNQNASSTELKKPISLSLLCNANTVTNGHNREEIILSPLSSDAKTMTNGHDQNNVYVNSVNISEVFKLDDQIVENLIQKMFHDHIQSVISFKNDFTSLDISEPNEISKSYIQNIIPGFVQSLSYLFDKAVKKDQKKILCWYYYSLKFENKVKSLTTDSKITDKIARTKIYKEIKSFLPNITDVNLYKKTQRAQKILTLFGREGVDDNSENVDYYGITDETLCSLCKLKHNDKDIEDRYEIGSYYVKCE
ncbi:16346_t:CDS:2 [Cetraspora pellucida]|uniref:16346_t:CDS:1 n=1 Tax=Cetraspora pellucida TaxID=1433469 RepID=A0A9N9ETL9_9GLOM|nr:16346_t:CDS:2 [Cetraspora pellucida]